MARMGGGFFVVILAATLGLAAILLVPGRTDHAWFLLRDGNPEAALVAAEAAQAEAPLDERSAWVLALIQTHLGLTDAAETTLQERLETSGGSQAAIHDLARHHLSMARPEQAIALFLALPPHILTEEEQRYVAGWLRAARNTETELRFLAALWNEESLDLAGGQRYAALLAASGDREASLRVYRTLDDNGELIDPIARQQFQALLSQTSSTE